MDISKSFTYPFEDKEWPVKLGLGTFLALIPFLNLAWMGYITDVIRNVSARNPQPTGLILARSLWTESSFGWLR